MTSQVSLRERKKLATREALSHAAWSLMVERGLDAVTPDAIAEAADVSPRTFRNYFASREEALLDGMARRGAIIPEAIRRRPPGEPVWDSFMAVLPDGVPQLVGNRDDFVVLLRACRDDPAVLGAHLVAFERGDWLLAEVIAERSGSDAGRDLAPRLLAAAAVVAIRTSIEMWAEAHVETDLSDLIRESLTQLRAGLPQGAGRTV